MIFQERGEHFTRSEFPRYNQVRYHKLVFRPTNDARQDHSEPKPHARLPAYVPRSSDFRAATC